MLPPIFIIGCARSGTSILGNFFQNNSQCQYFNEIDVWKKNEFFKPSKKERTFRKFILNPAKRHSTLIITLRTIHFQISIFLQNIHVIKSDDGHQLTENDVSETFANEVKEIEKNLLKPRIVIKNPRNSLRIPFIKKLFPNAKFIHIIRDGRDVTCSLMGEHSSYWAHIKPPNWKQWQKKHPVGPLKYAWQWNETINIINSDRKKIPSEDFFEMRYEDLVKEPEKTMIRVFEKFGIPFEKHQEALCKKVQNEMAGSFEATPGWTIKNHSKRIGRYKENLSQEELVEVEKIVGTNNNRVQGI